MKKLFVQFIKFGFVGALCFLIDFGLYTTCNYLGIPYLVSGVIGFSVSVIVNYILSMRYVFHGRKDISTQKEFSIFIILSILGLLLNELLLYLGIDQVYFRSNWLKNIMNQRVAEIGAKIIATAVVMVFNFVTRKLFLEEKNASLRNEK